MTRSILTLVAVALVPAQPTAANRSSSLNSAGARHLFTRLVSGHWVPANLDRLDPVSAAHLMAGASITRSRAQVRRLTKALDRRGDHVYALGVPFDAFENGTTNPPTAAYLVTLALTVEGRESAGMPPGPVVGALQRFHFDGRCWSYSDSVYDRNAGCVHDDNLFTLAALSHFRRRLPATIRSDYELSLAYERASVLPSGNWRYWDEAPRKRATLIDIPDLAWIVYTLRTAPDPRLRRLALRPAAWLGHHVRRPRESAGLPEIAAAALVSGRRSYGCRLLRSLPSWTARVDAPPGLPAGWHYLERRVIVAARVYVTFASPCGIRTRRAGGRRQAAS